uniref:Uncharacterized protein n=1 Tax=Globodera rostochiensis TaxID=31243 RepID=A0A914GU99_GLORO
MITGSGCSKDVVGAAMTALGRALSSQAVQGFDGSFSVVVALGRALSSQAVQGFDGPFSVAVMCIRLWHRFVQQFAQCLHNVVNPHQMLHCATKQLTIVFGQKNVPMA